MQHTISPVQTGCSFFSCLRGSGCKSQSSRGAGLSLAHRTLVQASAEDPWSLLRRIREPACNCLPASIPPLKLRSITASFPGHSGQKDNGNFVRLRDWSRAYLGQSHKNEKMRFLPPFAPFACFPSVCFSESPVYQISSLILILL